MQWLNLSIVTLHLRQRSHKHYTMKIIEELYFCNAFVKVIIHLKKYYYYTYSMDICGYICVYMDVYVCV